MRRRLTGLLWLVPPLLAAGLGLVWLFTTEAGLAWAWARVVGLSGGALTAERVSGRLAGPLQVQGARLGLAGQRLAVRRIELDWRPWALAAGRISVERLTIAGVDLALGEGNSGAAAPPDLKAPLPITIAAATVDGFTLHVPGAAPLVVEHLDLAGKWRGRSLNLNALHVAGPWGQASLQGRVATGRGRSFDATARWQLLLAGRTVAGSGHLGGAFRKPDLTVELTAPVGLRGSGTVAWASQPVAWEADLTLAQTDLAQVEPGWPELTVGGHSHLRGLGSRFEASTEGALAQPQVGRWNFSGEGGFRDGGWVLSRLQLQPVAGSGSLTASGGWPGDGAPASLQVQWTALGLPQLPGLQLGGHLTAGGTAQAYQGELALTAERQGIPPASVAARFQGDEGMLALHDLAGEWLGGKWAGEGRLAWREGLAWSASLQANGVDPADLDPRWAGLLEGQVQAHGSGQEAQVDRVRVSGRLAGHPLSLDASALLREGLLTLPRLTLRSGDALVEADGSVGERWSMAVRLDAPRLEELLPGSGGKVTLRGRLDGPLRTPRVRLRGSAAKLVYRNAQMDQASLQADVDLADGDPWQGELTVRNVLMGAVSLAQGHLRIDGSAGDHRIDLDGQTSDGAHLTFAAHGGWDGARWQGRVGPARFELAGQGSWQAPPADLTWGVEDGRLEPWCWEGDGRFCLGGSRTGGRVDATVEASGLPLHLLEPWLPRGDLALGGSVVLHAALSAEEGAITRLQANGAVSGGRIAYRLPEGKAETTLSSLTFDADGDAQGLRLHVATELEGDGGAEGALEFPGWLPGRPWSDSQQVRASLHLETARLEWLTYLEPTLLQPTGRLNADLTLSGEVAAPAVSGRVALRDGAVQLPVAGIRLEALNIEGRSVEGRQLELTGTARSGPGQVSLSGRLIAERLGRLRIEVAVKGERFEVMNLAQGHVLVSPDLDLRLEQGRVELTGSLSVPEANFNLPHLSEAVQVSPDEVIVDMPEQAEANRRWRLKLDVRLRAGDKVWLRGYGFTGRLAGAVRVRGETPGLTQAQGELNIFDGKYEAYGQNLVIDHGRLLFADSPPDNPGLDVRAVRKVIDADVTAGVEVTGRLQQPRLRVFSEPAMDESEALAWLVLGRPLSATSGSDADALYRAALASGSETAARGIALQFGLDEVSVESSSTVTPETRLVFGKYLSPRLYLQYAVGLWETANRVRLRYTLGRHWTLKMEQGAQSSSDLLYTFERE